LASHEYAPEIVIYEMLKVAKRLGLPLVLPD